MKNHIQNIVLPIFALVGMTHAADIKVDFSAEKGPIRPVHSVGQGPLLGWCDFSMFHYLKEANIPYARLHDVGGPFGKDLYVDIPNIFRDFKADENQPENYDFTYTDMYLKALIENGVEPYFRLGVTIENSAEVTKKPYRIYPPADFAKWARICEHVIRHYTEGWANGYQWKITYWEIWNEADDFVDHRNSMWYGTWRQYCELYDVAAKHLKARFPHLKIGGYGKCRAMNVTYELEGKPVPEAEVYRHRCFVEFCDFIREHHTPLDFFSFHLYDTKPHQVKAHVDYHQRLLAKAGYGDVELHLNEWLYGDRSGEFWKSASLASMIGEFILVYQQCERLYMANLYDAECGLGRYAPLFDPIKCKPSKSFYALKDFGVLYRLGREVRCDVSGANEHCLAVAAKGKDGAALMIVNNAERTEPLACDFGGLKPRYCLITDDYRLDTFTELPTEMPPYSILLAVF